MALPFALGEPCVLPRPSRHSREPCGDTLVVPLRCFSPKAPDQISERPGKPQAHSGFSLSGTRLVFGSPAQNLFYPLKFNLILNVSNGNFHVTR